MEPFRQRLHLSHWPPSCNGRLGQCAFFALPGDAKVAD